MHPNIWKPFTIIKGAPEPVKVVRGEGIWLTLEDGRRIMDCISSWWVNLHGHSHPHIANAIADQAKKLEHVIFANYSHDPAERLAEELTQRLPGKLNRVFYSDNGSTSVEVALKVAFQYWQNKGEKRPKFLAFEGAYHGDTLGAMSAGERSVFSQAFDELMFDVEFLPYPQTWIGDRDIEEKERAVIEELKRRLEEAPGTYAGVIIEPLIQGSGGMRMCREPFLKDLREATQGETLLLFDEVMTGFGRTGEWFACRRAGVEPDLICLAKGITGGFLPLSVTVVSDDIYEAFHTEDAEKTLWHGHSYTANPLGCAAGLASLDLMEENQSTFRQMEKHHISGMKQLQELFPQIRQIRVKGTVAACTIDTGGEEGYLNNIGHQIKSVCADYGLLVRPLGNVLYLMPPYCITEDELRDVYQKLTKLLGDLF